MNKEAKSLIVLFLAFLLGSSFVIFPVQAQNDKLILGVSKKCDIQYTGDRCVAELKLTNNTGEILDGEAFLHIDYQGVCSNNELRNFDGEGIEARFSINSESWLDFSNWNEGTTTVSGFDIKEGENGAKLEIETVPNLCPGRYTFTLTLEGTAETEYITRPTIIGSVGGYYTSPTIPTTDTGEVTATPEAGGITTLTNPDGSEIKLTIPSDTVSQNTNFTIDVTDVSSVNRPEPETGLFLIAGLVYEIKAEVNGEFITSFNKALTLSFTYTDEQIEGLDEASLKIYYWDDIQNQWITLENSKVDMDNNTVIASIDHFTLFALIGLKTVSSEEEKIGEEEEEETPRGETEEKIGEEEEEIILGGETEEGEKGREAPAEEERVSIEGLQRGLASMMAAIGMTWGEISKSAFLTIVVILCLMGLVLIGIREWRLFQKKRKR